MTRGSSWRSEPAAELRGLAKVASPAAARDLVQAGEVGERQVDLAPDFDAGGDGRRAGQHHERDGGHGTEVLGDVLTDLSVAPGGARDQAAGVVPQGDGQPVDLGLEHETQAGRVEAGLGRQLEHARVPGAQFGVVLRVRQRKHGLQMPNLRESRQRLGADALSGRIGRDELGMGLLQPPEFTEQLVVLVIVDLRAVQDVVTVVVVTDGRAQLLETSRGTGGRGCDLVDTRSPGRPVGGSTHSPRKPSGGRPSTAASWPMSSVNRSGCSASSVARSNTPQPTATHRMPAARAACRSYGLSPT